MRRTQEDRSAGTKAALVAAARELFTERGYADVPADEIVRAAGVTRGALYHHYGDKQGLFRVVFEEIEEEVMVAIRAATDPVGDVALKLVLGLGAFLDICERADVRRIALTDAPAVLGWATWREIEHAHGLGLITEALDDAISAGVLGPQPVSVLAQLMLSAVIETALLVANSEDPATTRREAEQVFGSWIAGLLGVGGSSGQNAGPLP
jgi:AcrR family transcriptional regulator